MTPTQISFQGMHPATAIEEDIHERVEWLGAYGGPILGCHVAVQVPHRHRTNGRTCRVAIRLSVPGQDVVVDHEAPFVSASGAAEGPVVAGGHDGVRMMVHAAFDIARRRLEDVGGHERTTTRPRVD